MASLDGELAAVARLAKAAWHLEREELPQAADLPGDAQDDVDRQAAIVERPRPVLAAGRAGQRPLAPGAGALAAVTVRVARAPRRALGPRQPQLPRHPRPHDWANIGTGRETSRREEDSVRGYRLI